MKNGSRSNIQAQILRLLFFKLKMKNDFN